MDDIVAAQGVENQYLRGVITQLTDRVAAAEQAASADVQALNDAKHDYEEADDMLALRIAAVTKMAGPKGDTGTKGEKGDTGDKGDQGEQGGKGEKGVDGRQGVGGAPGAKGDKGEKGADGRQGDDGAPGPKGAQGAKGAMGQAAPTPSPPKTWTVAGNINHDLGNVNLYTHFGMASMGLGARTEYRLRCWDTDDGGKEKTMYLRGVSAPQSSFAASTVVDATGWECSMKPDFSNPKRGGDCLQYNDVHHTYIGQCDSANGWDFMWSLYTRGRAFTLRHCSCRGGGVFSSGQIAYYNP